jgi:hypothetical protein
VVLFTLTPVSPLNLAIIDFCSIGSLAPAATSCGWSIQKRAIGNLISSCASVPQSNPPRTPQPVQAYRPKMSAEQSPPNSGVTGDSLSTALKDRLEATFVDIKDLSGESD